MAYQKRGYWYRSRREGGRVVTDYLGNGEAGVLIALLDNSQRAEDEHAHEVELRDREALRAAVASVNEFCSLATSLTRAALIAEGYHTHKGQWRKKRNGRE